MTIDIAQEHAIFTYTVHMRQRDHFWSPEMEGRCLKFLERYNSETKAKQKTLWITEGRALAADLKKDFQAKLKERVIYSEPL